MLKLKSLTESLEAKYLTEQGELVEKFGDMPSWLSKRILTTKYTNTDGQVRSWKTQGVTNRKNSTKNPWDIALEKNPNFGPSPTYGKSRGEQNADDSLFGQLNAHNINMDSVKVIEGDKPTKRTDERLKEPNIPIFLFKNGQVYMKGINDNEEYAGDGEYKKFKYLPMKTLLSDEVEKFAYIDGSDDSNFTSGAKKLARTNMRRELAEVPNYFRTPDEAGKSKYMGRGVRAQVDKSGYLVVPTPEKYKDKLAELKCTKIYDILDEYYNYLNDVRDELAYILSSSDLKNSRSSDSDYYKAFRTSRNMFSLLDDAVDTYVSVLSRVDRITNDPNLNEDDKKRELISMINHSWEYKELRDDIEKLKRDGKSLFNTTIDWI